MRVRWVTTSACTESSTHAIRNEYAIQLEYDSDASRIQCYEKENSTTRGQNSDFTMKEKSSHQRVNLEGVEKRRYRLES